MINAAKYIRQAYYAALNGNVPNASIYKEDAPIQQSGNYIVVRVESQTDDSTNHCFTHLPVVILDIVTPHNDYIDPDIVEAIDEAVQSILKPTVENVLDLSANGLQHVYLKPGEPTYLSEDDGTKRYYRKITRYFNRITEI